MDFRVEMILLFYRSFTQREFSDYRVLLDGKELTGFKTVVSV